MNEKALKSYIGTMDQLARIRTSVLDDGRGRGIHLPVEGRRDKFASPMNLLRSNILDARFFLGLFSVLLGSSALAQVTNTNTVTNGGIINAGNTEIITNTVTSPISAAITNNGSLQFWQTTELTVSGVISGSGTVTKASGSGNLTLSGSNTFSGKVTVASGRLDATGVSDSVGGGLGQGTQVELGGGANLQVTVGAGTTTTTTRSLIFNGNGTLGNPGRGSLVWNGNTTFNSSSSSAFLFNSPAGGTNVFAGVIGNTTNNSAVSLTFQSTQIWKLTGSNTFSGGITIGGGKVIIDKLADSGQASSIGTGNFRIGGFSTVPVLEYVGSGSTNNRQLRLGAGAAATGGSIINNGTGALVFNNATFMSGADMVGNSVNRAIILGGTNAADNTISGAIGDVNLASNSIVSVVKADSGKWVLSGVNTYSGGTTVSNGVLELGQTGSLRFVIKGSGTNNQISGTGTLSLKGKFDFDLTGAATNVGSSWTVVASTLASSYESSFGITGFIPSGGQWSRNANGRTYVFDQTNGRLSVWLPVSWSVPGPFHFWFSGTAQSPVVLPTGSTGAATYSFTGIEGTSYSSTNSPVAPGRYRLTVTVASDGTYAASSRDVYFTISTPGNSPAVSPLTVQTNGSLQLDNRPFTGVGVNYFSAFERALDNATDTSFEAGFATLGRWGVPFARVDLSGYWPSKANLFFTNRPEYFRRLDRLVASAEQNGVGLIPSLFWTTFNFSDLAGEPLDQLAVSNSVTRQLMREFATEIVNRYKNSRAIWAWEFGNEWNLAVDLPNATEWLPPTLTELGNPPTRDPVRDVLATDTILPAMLEFANLVRELDPGRPISTGHAMSRPSQWHQDQWKRGLLSINLVWRTDSLAEAEAIALRQCPAPYDLLSVHVYENDTQRLPNFAEFAARAGKALFVGEFGTPPNLEANYASMLATVRQYSPLAAVWVFDRPVDEYNITTTNARSWMLRALLPDTFETWSRGYGVTEKPDGGQIAFGQYVFGAAVPGGAVPPSFGGVSGEFLELTAVVRTNDASVSVCGQTTDSLLPPESWSSDGVDQSASPDQTEVLPGCVRRTYRVPTSGTGGFLRIHAE